MPQRDIPPGRFFLSVGKYVVREYSAVMDTQK